MAFFLLVFILLYGSLHYYFYTKTRKAFTLSSRQRIILIALLVALLFAPIIERSLVRLGSETAAEVMAFAGYVWMGVIFLFFNIAVLFDIYAIIVRISGCFLRTDISRFIPSPRLAFYVPMFLAILIAAYGYFEAKHIMMETVTISSSKIPRETGRIRIVQISDVHIGVIVREDRLREMLKLVIAAKPDILVSTGDLLDAELDGRSESRGLLKDIEARYGKYAITGNHEFYAGLNTFRRFINGTGFKILRGEGVVTGGIINIVGVDDPAGERMGLSRMVPEKELLMKFPARNFTLLLKHKPLVDQNAAGHFDLQLSGHTHRGQIFPFNFVTRLVFPYNSGLFRLEGGSLLYVSPGTGTWGPPIRFGSPPQITIIDLIPGEQP
jgi:predicted MPP superfamily phosphohydrolase